ncbi:unnamed protein product, partial [Anisakis simplex]|uniref:Uncharacterized protein n=1 Tax=Anisakis simplex TaxID=6269 RepID=A0A0M3JQA8_ANISI
MEGEMFGAGKGGTEGEAPVTQEPGSRRAPHGAAVHQDERVPLETNQGGAVPTTPGTGKHEAEGAEQPVEGFVSPEAGKSEAEGIPFETQEPGGEGTIPEAGMPEAEGGPIGNEVPGAEGATPEARMPETEGEPFGTEQPIEERIAPEAGVTEAEGVPIGNEVP